MTGSSDGNEYDVPRPSKIKLKETKSERAQKLYDRELKRQRKRDHLISRANGYAVSPPHRSRGDSESLTPPRHRPQTPDADAVDAEDEMEKRERMANLEQEEMDRLASNPFASYSMPDVHVPKRFRQAPTTGGGGTRDAIRELKGSGTAPALGSMNDDEYTTFIRQGMERLRNLAEADERDALQKEKQRRAEERLKREEASEKRRQEWRERRRAKAKANTNANPAPSPRVYRYDEDDVGEILRDSKSLERTRYINLWASLAGEIQQVEMRYRDIPWPVYGGKSLDKADVRTFLFDLAGDKGGAGAATTKEKEKKVLRDAIRIFHPDRFFGRFLDRVRESDRDRVKEGVEKCSRIINDLAAENAAR